MFRKMLWRRCCCQTLPLSSMSSAVQSRRIYMLSTPQSCCCHHRMLQLIGASLKRSTQHKARQCAGHNLRGPEEMRSNQSGKIKIRRALAPPPLLHRPLHPAGTACISFAMACQHFCSLPWVSSSCMQYQAAVPCNRIRYQFLHEWQSESIFAPEEP